MQSPASTEEFVDMPAHLYMWHAFSGMILKAIIGIVVLLLFLGWITGVL